MRLRLQLQLQLQLQVPYVDYGKLQVAIEKTLDSMNLQKVPTFITKVIQVHETQLVRHGMMVVGESGSGKTTNVLVLAQALAQLYEDKVVDRDGFYKVSKGHGTNLFANCITSERSKY